MEEGGEAPDREHQPSTSHSSGSSTTQTEVKPVAPNQEERAGSQSEQQIVRADSGVSDRRRKTQTQHQSPPQEPSPLEANSLISMINVRGTTEQRSFFAKFEYTYSSVARVIESIKRLDASATPRALLTLINSDIDLLQKLLMELQWTVYEIFENNAAADSDKTDRELALEVINELRSSFDKVRERALQKKDEFVGSAGGTGLKPPKLTVPKFSGNHAEWPAFKNNFQNLVRLLPAVDKLRLLVEAVKGNDAQDSVKDLSLTTENWDIAWKRVTSRYDSPREIAHAALRPLLEFPAMEKQQEAGLHKLIATVRTTMAQLDQIDLKGVSTSDVLYLHLIMGRLDSRTIHEFTRTLTTSDVPSLESCIEFLEKRAKDVALVREIKQNAGPSTPKATATSHAKGKNDYKKEFKNRAIFKDEEPILPLHPNSNGKNRGKTSNFPIKAKPAFQHHSQRPPTSQSYGTPKTPYSCAFCNQNGHRIQNCPKYQSLDHHQKKKAVKAAKLCFSCLSPQHTTASCVSNFNCFVCNGKHHTSLHIPTSNNPLSQPLTALSPIAVQTEQSGLVPTARILLEANGKKVPARSLLDTGAAGCFITASLVSHLKLRPDANGQDFAMANGQQIKSSGTVTLNLSAFPQGDFSLQVRAHVMPVLLSSSVPSQYFHVGNWKHLENIRLADPGFNRPAAVDFIIGLPVLDNLMLEGRIPGSPGQPTAYKTQLGYIIMGPRPNPGVIAASTEIPVPSTDEINFDLQRFWNVDTLQTSSKLILTPEEQFCEDHYTTNTTRLESGRYQVRWPLLKPAEDLGFSLTMATNRWLSVERKLLKTPETHAEYIKQLQEYLDLDQMEPVPSEQIHITPSYYIPHHAVIKLSSSTTKLRIVFDASAKSSSGLSLNSLLPPGPSTQPDLFRQLLHFRENQIALKADVTKMYRQIQLYPDETDLTRIIWRSSPGHPLGHYRLKVVPFGVTTAPYLACRTLLQLADDEEAHYPEAAQVLRNRFYVDDLGTSVSDQNTATKLYTGLTQLLEAGGFQLRKWATNSNQLLMSIPKEHQESSSSVDMDDSSTIKTLGISWSPSSDAFTFTCNPDMQRNHTKRNILSETSKVFDPLGLISPVTLKAKILMQKIWKHSIGWDDPLPVEISEEWSTLSEALTSLDLYPIPRPLRMALTGIWELHGFADASQDAYAAVVYIREITNKTIRTNLIASKTRVAPLKPVFTIPRMELQAAVLLVDLVSVIKETITIPISRVYYWTDSAIALHWLKATPQRWKLFIRNRVSEIQEKSSPDDWAHVVSAENPADCASRGLLPTELKYFSLWWKGPEWLKKKDIRQPPVPGMPQDIDQETASSPAAVITKKEESMLDVLSRVGSWSQIQRPLARVLAAFRFRSFRVIKLEPTDFGKAETVLIRLIQHEVFADIMDDDSKLTKKAHEYGLKALRPFRSEDGTLRVGGRLHLATLPYDARHPRILPKHELVRSLIMETHVMLLHAGQRVILHHLRQRFWLVNGTKHIKSTINKCIICFPYHAQPETQLMGQLPSSRVSLVRPFAHAGVDFAGPYQLKNFTGRGGNFKAWICLFTCMATRAIHLELVSSLSADGFLNAFRRFISRRGKPSNMYSDNGTNFVGAHHHLSDHLDHFQFAFEKSGTSVLGLDLNKIHWAFSPPLGPHHGGAWEVCVRLVKTHLQTQLKDSSHTWEEFETLLISIEAIVNSRPLTPMDDDPESLEVLTPGHFLIGTSLTAFPEADLSHLKLNKLSQYQLLTRQFQDLWKRWQKEYLTELQRTHKWSSSKPNLRVGDMVLLMDDISPPLKWRVGRVKAVHPGADQLVRVVTTEVATAKTTDSSDYSVNKKDVVRPITKLARLPLDTSTTTPGPGLNLIRPHTRVPVATWLASAVLMSLLQTTTAQSPTSIPVPMSITVAILACVVAMFGAIMNGFTIYNVIYGVLYSKSRISYRLCTLSLCISDFIIAAYLIPVAALRYFFRSWVLGQTMCQLSCVVLYGTVTWALFNLIFIATFRYFKIRKLSPNQKTNVKAIISCIITMMLLSYTLPMLAYFNIWGTIGRKSTDASVCTILPDDKGQTPKTLIWVLGVFLPFGIIYSASFVIYFRVRQQKAECTITTHHGKALLRLRRTIFRVLVSFIIGYQPILVFNVVDNDKTKIPAVFHISTMFLAWFTTIAHPLVYLCRPAKGQVIRSAPRLRDTDKISAKPTALDINGNSCEPALQSSSSSSSSLSSMQTKIRVPTPAIRRPSRCHLLACCILLLIYPAEALGTTNPLDTFFNENEDIHPNVPRVIFELPLCEGLTAPLSVVPSCISTAFWIGVNSDASVCSQMRGCVNQVVSNDGSSCQPIPASCPNVTTAFIDPLTCQSPTALSTNSPPHVILKDALTDFCAVGNLHLRNCPHFKESIQTIPVLIIKGIFYPVTDLHISEDAALTDMNSYNCSCPATQCTPGNCHGDTTFCKNIGCVQNIPKDSSPCYCKFTNRHMRHVYNTPAGQLSPDCWGNLPMVAKVPTYYKGEKPVCDRCTARCKKNGIELRTPNKIPKYIKVTKNPGFVSITPDSMTTQIQLTNHMLVSQGLIKIEIWMPEADVPVILTQSCPRLNVCEVISCHFCYDRWVNVRCYNMVNWGLLILIVGVITVMILLMRRITRCMRYIFQVAFLPCKILWSCRRHILRPQPRPTPVDDEKGLPLLPLISQTPYQSTTVSRIRSPRATNFVYKGPLMLLIALLSLVDTTDGCSEFASMSASSSECRHGAGKETCHVQLNTRLAVSPIGQRSCFKIASHQQATLGTIEFQTDSISVLCDKQLLYYVPRPRISCQSQIQCYSLYSSSDCSGYKCRDFGTNDTVQALESTKDSLGWSTCLDLRYPTCGWWLTRDCNFIRTAFTNPTEEAYEVFNCPSWEYAVTLNVTTRFGANVTNQLARVRLGKKQNLTHFNVSLISVSTPPTPVLEHCFLRREQRVALTPCNERGEDGIGRVGEIQCNSEEAAQSISMDCRGHQALITAHVDTSGVRCSGDLVDPELLLHNHALPLKIAAGVITSDADSVIFDTSESSLLEFQLTSSDLTLTAEIEDGKCTASFIKLEGCYSCLSGAVIYIEAQTDALESVTATLECPAGMMYTHFVITNRSTSMQQIVQLDRPEVDVTCQLKCPANQVELQVKGHLHYLSNPNFQHHSDIISHHAVTSGGLDFHWISIIGADISSWFSRGFVFIGIVVCIGGILFVTLQVAKPKLA